MNKIGIVSLYYRNRNYGGQLQSYALEKYISDLGYNVEQICWERIIDTTPVISKKKKDISYYIRAIYRRAKKKIYFLLYDKKLKKRLMCVKNFEKSIRHSEKIYDADSISKVNDEYDAFVIGSDQVWNVFWCGTQYFLEKAPKEKYKFSYAASMPDTNLNDDEKNAVYRALEDFDSISVREKATADFLSELCNREVKHVLDPTLLLNKSQWDEISDKTLVDGKYVFCYFLGRDKEYRKVAKKFAKKVNLKLVTLPHLTGVVDADLTFADKRLYEVSPADFVSLIKNAEYVITDSFHAAVFSNIYKVKYYVFNRSELEMSERIVTLLDIFNSNERFLTDSITCLDLMLQMKDKNVSNDNSKFEKIQHESREFVINNLKKVYSG